MSVNQVAFGTTTLLAVGTIASTVLAASVASTVATVAFAILAITLAAVSMASITAWIHKDSTDAEKYFSTMCTHIGYAIPALYQFVAQTLLAALVQGLADGITKAISRKIGGDDLTVRIR